MRSSGIVETEITADGGAGVADRLVSSEIDLLVFDRAPQPFDKEVVAPGALAVHADGDGVLDQHAGEGRAGELAALIGVEDIRRAVLGPSGTADATHNPPQMTRRHARHGRPGRRPATGSTTAPTVSNSRPGSSRPLRPHRLRSRGGQREEGSRLSELPS